MVAAKEKDSSFKSKDEMRSSARSNMEDSTKPPTIELDATSIARRKTPILSMDKIKQSRRGAETLDLKDIKEIHNTFTRRNLLDATRIQDTKIQDSKIHETKIHETTKIHDISHAIGQNGMSPIGIRKGRETTKTSPGGNQFAKIVLETIRKSDYAPEEPSHQVYLFEVC